MYSLAYFGTMTYVHKKNITYVRIYSPAVVIQSINERLVQREKLSMQLIHNHSKQENVWMLSSLRRSLVTTAVTATF